MTLLSGRNGFYLLLATLALAALFAFGWVTLAGAQGEDSDTEKMEAASSDGDSAVPYNGPSGIWVTGNGKASGAPDIAVVSMGVESVEETAAAARSNAARAMQSVMNALTRAGVADADIQTRYFNISPRYQSVEIERCDDDRRRTGARESKTRTTEKTCYTVWESRLTGYSVSNQATVKVRDLDDVGTIIDQVTEAAGNLVRINGISFNIEDPQPLRGRGQGRRRGGSEAEGRNAGRAFRRKVGPPGLPQRGRCLQSAPAAVRAGGGSLRHVGFFRDLDLAWRTGHFRHSPGSFPDC